ncbi:MAG: OFA family MFS transporter, partial [Spirochaetota bacterium]|nr:OFA family MFS transporter [Spirochaetota bacterium]
MQNEKVNTRYFVIIGALLIQLSLGAIYAWSVFTTPLTSAGWSKADTQIIFSIGLAVFALVMILSGRLIPKIGPLKLSLAGALALGLGYILAGVFYIEPNTINITTETLDKILPLLSSPSELANIKGLSHTAKIDRFMPLFVTTEGLEKIKPFLSIDIIKSIHIIKELVSRNLVLLIIFLGVVGGAGIGLTYVVPIAVGMRWYPDKKGMITGLSVAGFGFGALLWIKLAGNWGNLIQNNGLGVTFIIYGIVFLITIVIGSIWMVFPPDGWKPKNWKVDITNNNLISTNEVINLTSNQMLRTHQFYMIFFTFLFGASAGLMSIGLMKLFPREALVANGIDIISANAITGTAMGVFFALANGLGRIGWGFISDKIGRKLSLFIMTILQGLMMILFPYMAGTTELLYFASALIGFNYGGNFALFPAITSDIFGNKNIGSNYAWVFLSYGIGGIFGPVMGGILGDLNNFPLAFTISGILCVIAALTIAFVNKPKLT